jgi:hypothetical protein
MSARGPQISDFVLDLIQGGTTEEIGQQVSAELQPPAETPPVETLGSQISAFVHGVIDEFVPPGPPAETPPVETPGSQISAFVHGVIDEFVPPGLPAETPPVETPGSQISAFVHGVIDEFVPPGPLEAPPGGTDLVGVNTFIHHPDWLV